MKTAQTLITLPTLDTELPFDVAVIELLGPEAARMCAVELTAEAAVVRIVSRSSGADMVPQRRRRAADGAGAPVVLLIEDTTRLAHGWAAAICEAFSDPNVVAACGSVAVSACLTPRYRALGRLEYGRFDGTGPEHHLPGNAFAVRRAYLNQTLEPREGIVEHDLERRLVKRGGKIRRISTLTAIYTRPDPQGARLATRFGHGRLFGSGRGGNLALGLLKAGLAMPVLSLRALRAARAAGPVRQWLPEVPWIVLMATAWALGELTGQIAGKGMSEGSWN
tara:strand:- start:36150 stop:36986 length:837 start_codon:yes stop_codon:yes gene_type:complete